MHVLDSLKFRTFGVGGRRQRYHGSRHRFVTNGVTGGSRNCYKSIVQEVLYIGML